MDTWDFLIILMVSMCPDNMLPTQAPAPLYQALQRLDARLDLADERDSWSPRFAAEVRWTRRALRDLGSAPPSADANRFPHHLTAQSWLEFNRAYRVHIEALAYCQPSRADLFQTILCETRYLATVWECVASVNRPNATISHRRKALSRLRDLIGPEAYSRGELPPGVPLWRFRMVD